MPQKRKRNNEEQIVQSSSGPLWKTLGWQLSDRKEASSNIWFELFLFSFIFHAIPQKNIVIDLTYMIAIVLNSFQHIAFLFDKMFLLQNFKTLKNLFILITLIHLI